jgi:hypothetical protein
MPLPPHYGSSMSPVMVQDSFSSGGELLRGRPTTHG